jgi:peroxin-16
MLIGTLDPLRTALRLFLLKLTRRPLLSPSIPERDLDPSTLPPASSEQPQASTSQSPPSTPDHLKNNRVKDFPIRPPNPLLSPHPQPNGAPQAVEDYLLPRALSTSSITPPAALVRPLSNPKDWISEVIYAIRPLIYGSLPAFCQHRGFILQPRVI